MKISTNGYSLDLTPTNLTKPGMYLLSVELSDGYAPPNNYSMKVFVLEKSIAIVKANSTDSKIKKPIG
jgi:hypothetical protein